MITSTLHDDGVVEVFDHKEYREMVKYLDETTGRWVDPSDIATCLTCYRSWDDGVVSSITPTPSGRCPFEYTHTEDN